MRVIKEAKGFTLLELAIVLVIIGILLGLVLRGSDLIESAKDRKVRDIPRKWEIPIWTFYDKRGHFPGDTDNPKDGLINTFTDLQNDLGYSSIAYPPVNVEGVSIEIRGLADPCASNVTRNVMLIGYVDGTNANLDTKLAQRLDEDIDGQVNGAAGRVRSCGYAGTDTPLAWPATGNTVATYFFDKLP